MREDELEQLSLSDDEKAWALILLLFAIGDIKITKEEEVIKDGQRETD